MLAPSSKAALRQRLTPMLLPLLIGLLCIQPEMSVADDPTAHTLIRKREDLLRSQTNVGRYQMQVVRPAWQRSVTFENWDEVTSKRSFTRILAPRKDEDTTFLKVDHNLWMYVPKLERDIKIPPSMMLGSWMGSDFTNDDLVKVSSAVDDYTHRTIGPQGTGADEVITIESLPKPEAPVVWGKLVHKVTPDGLPLETEFYDEHGKLLRRLVFENVKSVNGRGLPMRWTMWPLTEPGHYTVMDIEHIEFDVDIPATMFERANLSRKR
jgi:outer membrane lipoprotein-sorting protein